MADLARAGLVERTMGRGGGYRLAHPPAQISLMDIVTATDRSTPSHCILRGGPCAQPPESKCAVHDAFFAAKQALYDSLRSATLDQAAAILSARR